ncbi:DUF1479-domain-containing protein [Diplogelasinospora grovesii]|uniref:DUF1479-domain-containing protein n=1 Tax=Diplogelasinospora grovesii TaxID=303347 RepID=A0AAN6S3J5_9PEZI|nr:DUF1479-domain-containing protein [Diplogelasinospora grovesii]
MAAVNAQTKKKREGDISDSFASMSGKAAEPLPDRFRELKLQLVAGHEDKVIASWKRLLGVLRTENDIISRKGPAIIPQLDFSSLEEDLSRHKAEIKKRGAAVVRGVIPEDEARAYKFEIEEYVRRNPHTRGFPANNPQVIELYWSAPQLRARTHPSMLKVQSTLMSSLWHTPDPNSPISLRTPLSYADRLRIRQPGDAQFALGPHQDGGSVERWEKDGYGRGGVYDALFRGEWEESYDAFDASTRVGAVTDLYNGLGACSMFRMFQGWLAMSRCGPGQGTLLVNPLVKESTVYSLLRPFFRPKKGVHQVSSRERFLDPANWEFTAGDKMTSDLQGATPGHGQEFPDGLHPHLELERTMVHIPEVKPGDFVVWHCDTIHAVDRTHNGTSDSSVLYIPVCPTTEASAEYVAQQRAAFLAGTPGPDFPGGIGESQHVGRPTVEYVRGCSGPEGVQSMGLDEIVAADDDTPGGREAVRRANKVLGF